MAAAALAFSSGCSSGGSAPLGRSPGPGLDEAASLSATQQACVEQATKYTEYNLTLLKSGGSTNNVQVPADAIAPGFATTAAVSGQILRDTAHFGSRDLAIDRYAGWIRYNCRTGSSPDENVFYQTKPPAIPLIQDTSGISSTGRQEPEGGGIESPTSGATVQPIPTAFVSTSVPTGPLDGCGTTVTCGSPIPSPSSVPLDGCGTTVICGPISSPSTAETAVPGASQQTYSTALGGGDLNIRSGPGTSYAVVGQVPDGGDVAAVCETPGEEVSGPLGTGVLWLKVSAPGFGYISIEFVNGPSTGHYAPMC